MQFFKSVWQGRKMPVAELCSDALFIGSYYHFLFWHVEQPLTGTMRWAPPLLCHSSLIGYLEMLCYSVCMADRFLFSFYQPACIRCSYVWVWGLSGKEARLAWSFLEMACAPHGYLKNTPVQSKHVFFFFRDLHFGVHELLHTFASQSNPLSASMRFLSLPASRTWDGDEHSGRNN